MRKHKGESCNQYGQNDTTLCITRAAWRKKNDVMKKDVTLFIGGAYGEVSRKFAAKILLQFRRDEKQTNQNA